MPPLRHAFHLPLLLLLAACAGAGATAAPTAPAAAPVDAWRVPPLPAATPLSREEYARRRAVLAQTMEDGVLVVFGSGEPETDYTAFAQNSPFRYLTGVVEPGAALVIAKRGGAVRQRLFVTGRDPAREVWEGARLGVVGAAAATGITTSAASGLTVAVDSLLRATPVLYTVTSPPDELPKGATLTREQQLIARLATSRPAFRVVPLNTQLARLRGSKSAAELDLIRRAVYITALAQRAAMRSVEPGMNEFEIQALIEYFFRRNGAERPSFATIVGSGPNSTTLHYNADDRFMRAGETVVMDMGASYRGYAADVTRTVPVSGTFTPEQRAIYEIVLRAQKAAEAEARPGATLQGISQTAAGVIAKGLAELGLIEAPDATYDCRAAEGSGRCPQWRLFYLHGLSHGIGLDVHDPDNSYFGPFRVGSAFTIEPGIYVRGDALNHLPDTPGNRALRERLAPVGRRYANIGVRIEDDYFITPDGAERVSDGAPREVAEIEALMALPGPGQQERQVEVVEWYRGTVPR